MAYARPVGGGRPEVRRAGPGPEAIDAAAALLAAHGPATTLGVRVVEVGAGRAVLSLAVEPAMLNGLGVCHGGVLVSVAELAARVAAGTVGDDPQAVGASIELLSPARPGMVVEARAELVHQRGRSAVCDVALGAGGEALALVRTRLRLGRRPTDV